MGATINTAKAHKVRNIGDITLIFTWVNGERAMVLIPNQRRNAPWYIVMDSAAWKYNEPRYLAKQAVVASEVLGMDGQAARIGGMIHDHLDDLVRMPSSPPDQLSKATFGSLKMMADGREIGGEELRVQVGEGASYG